MSELSKNSNVLRIPTTPTADFFLKWLSYLYPLHKLSNNEKQVLAMLLHKRLELSQLVKDQAIINNLLLSPDSRNEIRTKIGMGGSQFNIIIAKLKRTGVIGEDGINRRYIPNLEYNSGQYRLILIFDFDGRKDKESNIQK